MTYRPPRSGIFRSGYQAGALMTFDPQVSGATVGTNARPVLWLVCVLAFFNALLSATAAPARSTAPAAGYHGRIGLGSWNTSVEYKDIVVTKGKKVLYRSDFEKKGAVGWDVLSGEWMAQNGAYRQESVGVPGIVTLGNPDWSDYTIQLKARKIAGEEGFLIFFNWINDTNFHCFNIGGWQNTQSAIQHNVDGNVGHLATVPHHVESNVWYDIRVVTRGSRIDCYVDSLLVLTSSPEPPPGSGRRGAIAIGTWNTSADYTDIQVVSNGVTLYQSDFANQGTNGWKFMNGTWVARDGMLSQLAHEINCRAIIGSPDWANYTLKLRARKTGGNEGFMIWFNSIDPNNELWFNIGGWKNTRSSVEQSLNGVAISLGKKVAQQIELNKWYDIQIVLNGAEIACYVNSNLIQRVYAPTYLSTNAVYLGYTYNTTNYLLRFQIGEHRIQGVLPEAAGPPPELEKGSLVQLSGICSDLNPAQQSGAEWQPDLEMALSSADAVVLLQAPPWLNLRRTLWLGGAAVCVLIFAIAWTVMVSHKNRQLKLVHQELKKANEELEVRVEHRTVDLARANADLSYEQALFCALLDNSSDYIYFKDANSLFIRCSQSLSKRCGLPVEAMIGKSDFDVFNEEYARVAADDDKEIIRTGNPVIGKLEKETLPDGNILWLQTTKMPWRNSRGEIIGTFGISRDISAIKEAEARLEKTHQQLVDASRMAGQAEVAASVLHNVGNVLNSVNTSSSLIQRQVQNFQAHSSLARVAKLMADHQHDLPGFFRDDARAGKLPVFLNTIADTIASEHANLLQEINCLANNIDHIKEIVAMQQNYARVLGLVETHSIASLMEDALRVHALALETQKIRVVRDFDSNTDFPVDKHRVLQILVNLISNAKWALSQKSDDERILTLSVRWIDEGLRVSVTDNGIGISRENLGRLFRHGFTTRKEGHGFGLHSSFLAARKWEEASAPTATVPDAARCSLLSFRAKRPWKKPATTVPAHFKP